MLSSLYSILKFSICLFILFGETCSILTGLTPKPGLSYFIFFLNLSFFSKIRWRFWAIASMISLLVVFTYFFVNLSLIVMEALLKTPSNRLQIGSKYFLLTFMLSRFLINSLSIYASSKMLILVGGGSFRRALFFYTNASIFLMSSVVNLERKSGMDIAADFLK